jgi:hypothetical protein
MISGKTYKKHGTISDISLKNLNSRYLMLSETGLRLRFVKH